MFSVIPALSRGFASASGGDKPRVFFGLTRLYSLRDRRIKAGPPQPRKVPFHRIGVSPPGTKYFCRDFKNPTTDLSNASYTIEYLPFEDIDAMGDMVLRREWKKPEVKVEKSDDPFAIVDENELLKEPIDLSFLLNILDGTLESSGRMLVLTSNFPERIDRALIRPGRIDMIVKFSKCSVKVLREMGEGFYDQVAPAHRMWSDPTMEGKWTPAEVNQILFRNFDTPLEALDELETLKPADLYGFQIEGHSQTPQSEGIQLGA